MDKPIVIIAGPTASGKTSLAISLAKKVGGEIINADSRTIYQEMDIATAKPSKDEMTEVPHHLFDICQPVMIMTAGEYKKSADKKIKEIHRRNRIPFLVGGTGLYLDSYVYDFDIDKTKPNPKQRRQLDNLKAEELIERIRNIDESALAGLDINNQRRLVRTLEIMLKRGVRAKMKSPKPNNVLYLALDLPRAEIYRRINERVSAMPIDELIKETKKLRAKYPVDTPALSGIGYREISDYLDEKITLKEALEEIKKRTRHYAKRQFTWFKKNQDIIWVKSEKEATAQIKSFLLYLKHA